MKQLDNGQPAPCLTMRSFVSLEASQSRFFKIETTIFIEILSLSNCFENLLLLLKNVQIQEFRNADDQIPISTR